MGLPHSLINAAKQGGVPVDQVELDKQRQTGNLVTKRTSVQENKDTSTSPWPYPHGMVCNKSITDRHKEMTGKSRFSVWIPSFLFLNRSRAQCLSSSASVLIRSTSEGSCRFQIDFVAFLRQHPLWLLLKWNSRSGHKHENSLKGWVPIYSSTVSPTISIKNDSLTLCKLVQLSKNM